MEKYKTDFLSLHHCDCMDLMKQYPDKYFDLALYYWQIGQFATDGMKILDTHFGSGSIALAVNKANQLDKMNLHLTACEIDEEYINKAIERIRFSIKQQTLNF